MGDWISNKVLQKFVFWWNLHTAKTAENTKNIINRSMQVPKSLLIKDERFSIIIGLFFLFEISVHSLFNYSFNSKSLYASFYQIFEAHKLFLT